jgi:hypothetical protein
MKIVGIGLNKTGTTTLGSCLKTLGFKHISCDLKAFNLFKEGKTEELLTIVKQYDSFEDWPWPLAFKEIDRAFPGSKFILTLRKTPEIWFNSLVLHSLKTGPTDYRKTVYGYEMPEGHIDEHRNFYENHNMMVREYFKERPEDLLEVCWENGDGWEKLARFLNKDVPNCKIPHLNKSTLKIKLQHKLSKYF